MSDVTIKVKANGPLLVEGKIDLLDPDNKAFDTDQSVIALCRCGASGNSPFCDGSHKKIDFESAPKAA